MPLGSAYDTTRSPLVNVLPLWVHVEPVANCGEVFDSRFIDASSEVLIDSLRARSFCAFDSPAS